MDAEERDIINYLKSLPNQFVSGREISRRAGGKWKFRENSNWATLVLARLLEKGIIESDSTNHFRFVPSKKTKEKPKKFVSPQIKKILEKSSKDFSEVIELKDEEEENY